jgi:hypothetical protein
MGNRIAAALMLMLIVLSGLVAESPILSDSHPSRQIASIDSQKPSWEDTLEHKHGAMKPGQSILASVHLVGKPLLSPKTLKLVGRVEFLQPVERARIYWELPDGVALNSGLMESEYVGPESEIEIPLEVLVSDDENYQIHLKVDATTGTSAYGAVTQFNTQLDTLDKPSLEDKPAVQMKLNQ